jgi:hypothetical protein
MSGTKSMFTVWQPGVRLVLLSAWVDDDGEPGHEVYPVLGLQARVDDDGDVYHEPLILFDDCVQTVRDARPCWWFGDRSATLLLEAAWPPSEDEKQLAPVAERLKKQLLLRQQRKLAREWW